MIATHVHVNEMYVSEQTISHDNNKILEFIWSDVEVELEGEARE